MGQKKDTLLRWVNCCSDAATTVERIKSLADGWFFIHILNFLRSHPTDDTDPWLQTINILREYKLQENVVDFDAAASGNEDELAKLIVICMHLTMVQKPCENIKEKTMWNLSTEDQKVIEAILLAIVNDDQLTRSRLIDVLQDNLQENSFTKSVMFYTSSPLSSLSSMKNSPLKRFLDSPMALRLTRLQKEISDKNEEIRRLQAELMTESDESSALSLRMDDLKRKVKDLEKKNTDLEQRLRDSQLPESSGPDTDVEITQMKKKIKKMQNEYEASCQKYCDLNIEYEEMKTRQEKDRKQVRQLQLDLNDTVARFERESAEYQLLLDSIRTENAELKHSLEEKAQWIDVLEEKSRTCSEMHARLSAPRSPCERESIGYSLLSIETEKLQGDLESYRRDLARQSDQFDLEKRIFQQRAAALEEDKRGLHRQVEEANLENQTLHVQLDQAKASLEQLSIGCGSLSKEKEELRHSLDELQSEFQKEMSRVQEQLELSRQEVDAKKQELLQQSNVLDELERTINDLRQDKVAAETSYTQQLVALKSEKQELLESHDRAKQHNAALLASFEASRNELGQQLTDANLKLKELTEFLQQSQLSRQQTEEQLEATRAKVCKLESDLENAVEEKGQLTNEVLVLQSDLESFRRDLAHQSDQFDSEKRVLEEHAAALEEDKRGIHRQVEEAHLENQSLHAQLDQAKANLEQFSIGCDSLNTEKEELRHSLDELLSDFKKEMSRAQEELELSRQEVDAKKQQILQQQNALDEQERMINDLRQDNLAAETSHAQDIFSLQSEKQELLESQDRAEQHNASLLKAVEASRNELERQLTDADLKLKELAEHLQQSHLSRQQTEEQMEVFRSKVLKLESDLETAVEEKGQLINEMLVLQDDFESHRRDMANQSDQFDSQKRVLEDHAAALEEDKQNIHRQIEEANLEIQSLHAQLDQAKLNFEQLSIACDSLNKEKEELHHSLDELQTEFQKEISRAQEQLELSRQEVDAKEKQILQQSNALDEQERMINDLRQDKVAAETSHAQEIFTLQSEKQELLESHDRAEQHNASLLASFETSRNELGQQLTDANLKLKELTDLLQQSHISRQQTEKKMEALRANVHKLEFDLKTAVEEKDQLTNEMLVLQAVQGEMKNLELAMEQLTSEIQELSCKKANLEKLREVLEEAKVTAEEESKQLRQEVKSKKLEISQLVGKIEFTELQLDRSNREQILLQARIVDLESTVSNLATNATETSQTVVTLEKQLQEREATLERATVEVNAEKEQSITAQSAFIKAISDIQSSSDNNRRELEASIASLKSELDLEKKRVSEEMNTNNVLALARNEASELAESLQVKLSEMKVEMVKLAESEALMKTEILELEQKTGSSQIKLENEKLDMEKQIAQLTLQLKSISSSNSDMESECGSLKSEKLQALQEKAQLEQRISEIEKHLQSTVEGLLSQLKTKDTEIQFKIAKVNELSSSVEVLKLQIETIVEEKETLEKDFVSQISTLNSEKETLLTRNVSVEHENQELKSELAVEKTKILQGKGEIMLEHRKEKAALEARLLVAQSQMKSMQEKLVNMTVANNSHAPLEHKVSMLTNELEAVNKAKSELEKRLDDSMSVRKEEMLSVKKEELIESYLSKASTLDSDAEIAFLRKKYDSSKKELIRKDEVINQYAVKFEKMQNQLDNLNEEVASLNMDKKKLSFENRSLKTEQNHLLAQISSEKDKANARNTRHSLALQRGSAASNAPTFLQSTRGATTNFLTNLSGGTLADAMIDARRRSMRPTRSEVTCTSRERQAPTEIFRAPQLAFGDGSDASSIFKVPPSRRDSTSSVCSNRSDISITSRGTNVPQGAGRLFTCDDEDGELFSSSYLNEMKEGKCRVEDSSTRVSELLRRNTMQPPHMRSAYPVEINDERLRQSDMTIYDQPKATFSRADNHDTVKQLSFATSMLSMNTPPAMNTRKRRSSSWNPTEMETPVMQPRKRRSYELDADLSSDSTDTRSISSSAERKKHRDASLTSYSRPGPPTPARNPAKENISTPSTASSPPKATSIKASNKTGSKRTTPAQGTKNSKLTPVGSLVRKVQAKLRSNIQASSDQNTPSSTRTTPRGSKLNIFRKPLGSRTYNSDAKL